MCICVYVHMCKYNSLLSMELLARWVIEIFFIPLNVIFFAGNKEKASTSACFRTLLWAPKRHCEWFNMGSCGERHQVKGNSVLKRRIWTVSWAHGNNDRILSKKCRRWNRFFWSITFARIQKKKERLRSRLNYTWKSREIKCLSNSRDS